MPVITEPAVVLEIWVEPTTSMSNPPSSTWYHDPGVPASWHEYSNPAEST